MISEKILDEYAKLAVVIGANVQKGQPIVIYGPVEAYEFIHKCAKQAYLAGASKVEVEYRDNVLSRYDYEFVETDTLKEVPSWKVDKIKDGIDKGICKLNIISPDPDLLEGIDATKIREVQRAWMQATSKYSYYTMNSIGQWSIVAYPNVVWAKKVYPDLNDKEAYEKLWEAILYTSRCSEDKSVEDAWNEHNAEIRNHSSKLNNYNFKSLHFKNSLGTDLVVGLVKDHVWEGGSEISARGIEFNANIPTEEVFTMPDRRHIDGTVVSTKPLAYSGKLINQFKLTFKDGRVIAHEAVNNQDILENLLDTDEGSRSLGEVALISHDSPISNMNILFYDTLFDENASCHLALGQCYPTNKKGGADMSEDELYEVGGNKSMNHVDFMFGNADMNVIGTTYDGEEIQIFKDGNFCI